VPWVLLVIELMIATLVLGPLSAILVVQLTLVPGALFGGGGFTAPFTVAFTGVVELVSVFVVFALTMATAFIVGLPMRLIPPFRRLWLANGEVTIVGAVLGALSIAVAYALGRWKQVEFPEGLYRVFEPALWPLLIGWLVLAFSLVHLVWPARWLPRRARTWWAETQTTRRTTPRT
jgi:hypothetical protein